MLVPTHKLASREGAWVVREDLQLLMMHAHKTQQHTRTPAATLALMQLLAWPRHLQLLLMVEIGTKATLVGLLVLTNSGQLNAKA